MAKPLLVIVTALAALAAGCSESVDVSEIEENLRTEVTKGGLPVTTVSCPEDIEEKTGATFECTATNEGQTRLTIASRVTSVEDDQLLYKVQSTTGAADGEAVAERARVILEDEVGEKAKRFTCPATIDIPTQPDVTCELETMDGTTIDTSIAIGPDGSLNVQVADEPN